MMLWDGSCDSSRLTYWALDESPYTRDADNIYGSPAFDETRFQRLTKFTDMPSDTFETARLLLRPVAIKDVDAIFDSYAQDEEVVRYLIWRPHRSLSETQAYVERCIATPSEVERTYMVLGRADNMVRGAFALRQRAPHRKKRGRPWPTLQHLQRRPRDRQRPGHVIFRMPRRAPD